jgi:lipopolysaccharide biosynthesis glycosyltransferase
VASSAEPIRVALAIDAAYCPWAATLIWSCLRANVGDRVEFDVLHDGTLSAADDERMRSLAQGADGAIRLHSLERLGMAALPATADFGPIVWLRFYLPQILRDAARVIYLDADTFITDRLRPLWETDLQGAPLGAVANVVEPGARPHVAELGVDYPGGFFNSGVLLLDLDRMRAQGATATLIEFAQREGADLLWPDQDTLNSVFKDRWHPLHPRWNAQTSLWAWRDWAAEVFDAETLDAATRSPAIRHFEGPYLSKPWHYLCSLPERETYRAALRQTPWKDQPLDDHTVGTRLIRLLPVRAHLPAYIGLFKLRARLGRPGPWSK